MAMLLYLLVILRRKPSQNLDSVEAIIPAFNEAPCLEASLTSLLNNRYIKRVICVNDGSTDDTAKVLEMMAARWGERLLVIHQKNTGKGGALMNGVKHATAEHVFLSDADTRIPSDSDGLGFLLAEIERGADAVGGIPSSDLRVAGVLPHIRATVKLPMIAMKRTLQQVLGGAPFIISGACGMFRTEVLLKHGFSDRTKVEDLDLTWTLVQRGYRIRQCNRCIVYPQECNTLREEWKRWRRWIVGYAVCIRLHRKILLTRFGLFSILPMFFVVAFGVLIYLTAWGMSLLESDIAGVFQTIFPLLWVTIVCSIGFLSALLHRSLSLVVLAPLSVLYVLLSYAIWMIHGVPAFFTGREPTRDKPTRYTHMVESTHPVVDKQTTAAASKSESATRSEISRC